MNGKVVMVTGATSGIGVVTAHKLAEMGAEVVIVSRLESRLETAVRRIKAETGNDKVSYIQGDLSSTADVRHVANTFLQNHNRLDVLVNNAGAMFWNRLETVDGYEMTLALNHLSYFLLTHLLLDVLKRTASEHGEARIINVASDAHVQAKLNLDDIQQKQWQNGFWTYGVSKLMNIMFTYELARRLEGTGVTANVLHPGFIETGFGKNNGKLLSGIMSILHKVVAKPPTVGAETPVYLASSPEVKGITGKYWVDKKQKRSNEASYNVEEQKRLWEISEELTGITQSATA
jgi:NAD(P)-dependent dehydrogenase (short-subunit alcohol dehydrogenase family)